MFPARQRFEALERAAGQIDDRLIEHLEFALLQGPAQIALQLHQQDHLIVHGRIEQHVRLVLAARLGLIQGDIGVAQQVFRPLAVAVIQGDADAGRGVNFVTADVKGFGQALMEALGAEHGVARLAQFGQEDQEFIPAHAGDQIAAAAQRGVQALADHRQHPVADVVAQTVVDDLEPVDVEQQQGGQFVPAVAAVEQFLDFAQDHGAVGQSGERVVQDVVLQAGLDLLALGNIAQHRQQLRPPVGRDFLEVEFDP